MKMCDICQRKTKRSRKARERLHKAEIERKSVLLKNAKAIVERRIGTEVRYFGINPEHGRCFTKQSCTCKYESWSQFRTLESVDTRGRVPLKEKNVFYTLSMPGHFLLFLPSYYFSFYDKEKQKETTVDIASKGSLLFLDPPEDQLNHLRKLGTERQL